MATTFKPSYGTNTAITITLTSLANSTSLSLGYRQSAAVDNSTNLFGDVHIYGHAQSNAAPTANNTYTIFLYWSNDGGTTYTNGASGSDATYTQPDSDANMVARVDSVLTAVNQAFNFPGISFCRAAGLLFLPQKWGIIFKNGSGQALDGTAGHHVFSYQGVNLQGV
ncbi:MAG TPA: hypothetical protein VEZ44_05485 [bacterium]|nr:hypothetical protein [bacterium]